MSHSGSPRPVVTIYDPPEPVSARGIGGGIVGEDEVFA